MHSTTDSVFIKHTSCPSCGSRDNLGVYSDGHSHCFGCGYRESPTIQHRLSYSTTKPQSKGITPLPYDSTSRIGSAAYAWLLKTITPAEITQLRVLWSNSQQLLIFPFFSDAELIGWIARNFGDTGPKYRIHGVKTKISKVYGNSEPLVFTEDLLSSVVVARSASARPLFGTSLPQEYLQRNSRMFLWLDRDKARESILQCNHYKQYGYDINPIITENDPKACSKDLIDTLLYPEGRKGLEGGLKPV